mmetsp:Transcript_38690/g.50982  ORF Transcript_38690/g.50982 Transcript_38690/m.50982 type:complete len:218 (+) Transcript_38690:83-736(+)|eukprot:CAMPEP_0117797956 /NCGR_PEP_ID=MMETSP0948-20121206/12843_1 /TAXON_ID=44440 /ORGANISM="Chattonella subsalsa, Strain CCMP2191" /LENGTH=217 /DNA_ID=CAMNT_0005629463 /DNA_START=80 /DNA_END=733 /DNA_ORIENTATION=-
MAASAIVIARSNLEDTLNSHWKDDKASFGFRMLSKMGWKEGKGLGKNEDGQSDYVSVSKKVDNLGLGCDKDTSGNSGWSSSIQSFTDVLAQLNATYGTESKGKATKEINNKKKKNKKKKLSLSGKRVMYSKMLKSKDISKYSIEDKAKILGLHQEMSSSSEDKKQIRKEQKKKNKRKSAESEIIESNEKKPKKSKKRKGKKSTDEKQRKKTKKKISS